MQARRVAALRPAHAALPAAARARPLRARAAAAVARVAATQHETLSTFLAPPAAQCAGRVSRAHRFLLLCSAIAAMLTVQVGLDYSRSRACCLEARALLACEPRDDLRAPCRGYWRLRIIAQRFPTRRRRGWGTRHPGGLALRRVSEPGQPARPAARCADWCRGVLACCR
jgi:hypothetical protein